MNVCEIFYSIQGESTYAGMPFVFVRLSGCNLRCSYCDTTYAYSKAVTMSVADIIKDVKQYGCKLVLITGGEPLLQPETPELATAFLDEGFFVSIETNGSIDISHIDKRAVLIMDIKTPLSGMSNFNYFDNLSYLKPHDEIKFVISGYEDFLWAINLIEGFDLLGKNIIHFSPNTDILSPSELAKWILNSHKSIRLNIQLHKYIFGTNVKGV